MKWVCQHCGHVIERKGYTEICPQCWRPTMKGELDHEQCEKKNDSGYYQEVAGAIPGLDKH